VAVGSSETSDKPPRREQSHGILRGLHQPPRRAIDRHALDMWSAGTCGHLGIEWEHARGMAEAILLSKGVLLTKRYINRLIGIAERTDTNFDIAVIEPPPPTRPRLRNIAQ
jgi:hypothetical protein